MSAREERLYLVTYDIADPRRLRAVHRLLLGQGEWLQYSVFQCRLDARRRVELAASIDGLIHHAEDHVLVFDLGPADGVAVRVSSHGKKRFEAIERQPVII